MRKKDVCERPEENKGRKNSTKAGKSSNRRRNSSPSKDTEISKDGGRRAVKSLDDAGRDNDPNWYISDKTLAEQVCHLSFNSFIGEGTVPLTDYAVPSVVRVAVNPSPFNSYDIDDATTYHHVTRSGLNLAITKMYTLLASYSGRAASYAPQDVGTIVLAMGEVVSMVEDLRRAVGVCYTFSERNRALPKILLTALGYDYDDFIKNRAIYISRLNAIITRFNSLPILANIPYILKCRDMYQKVYTDSISPEATLIVMVPNTTWTLDEQSYSGGTILSTTGWTPSGSTSTFKVHLDTLENMVEALFNSSTLNIIYADLLNLASKMKVDMFKLDYVTDDYIVMPEYNENFLLQLHNADVLDNPAFSTYQAVYQTMMGTPANDVYPDASTNGLIYNPCWDYSNLIPATHVSHYTSILDLPNADPSIENIIEGTRYKAMLGQVYTLGTARWSVYGTLPDHYITTVSVFDNSTAPSTGKSFTNSWWTDAQIANMWEVMLGLEQVDWAPLLYWQRTNSEIGRAHV